MGLKSFLKQQGFIEDDSEDKIKEPTDKKETVKQTVPVFFPVQPNIPVTNVSSSATSADPSFVTPLQQNTNNAKEQPDATFIKFFEDELVKANLPGQDYFEFRQLLIKTQEKMAAKGVFAPEMVLQAVLTSFEAQDISTSKLIEAAKHYKDVLKQKNDDFLKGAATEKNNQLQKRQDVLRDHDGAIKKLQQQIQQLELQKQQLETSVNKEKTQMEVDKTLGKEGIEKIEKAERLISLAHEYMQSAVDADIKRLQVG